MRRTWSEGLRQSATWRDEGDRRLQGRQGAGRPPHQPVVVVVLLMRSRVRAGWSRGQEGSAAKACIFLGLALFVSNCPVGWRRGGEEDDDEETAAAEAEISSS